MGDRGVRGSEMLMEDGVGGGGGGAGDEVCQLGGLRIPPLA